MKDLYQRWGAEFAKRPDMPLDEWRAMVEEWPQLTAEPGSVDYVEVDANGVPAMWAAPKRAAEDRVVLAFHGGGFVTGSMYTHRKLFGHLAKAIGARALVTDYRRAPEHTHPAPVEDALAAYRWLLDQGIESRHIAFAGDSAGGGMVVTTMLLARHHGLPLPGAGMPLSPWFDFEATGASHNLNADKDALLNKEFGQVLARPKLSL
ncbi:MAG TPA: alpha/beta hydrolase fold domain-containing protein [Acidimicrobiales bacterium]